MTIHVLATLALLFKIALFGCGCLFICALVCFPINDKPTSKTQIGISLILSAVAFILTFTDFIKFTL